mgnify:CR=1 FL=1
MIEALSVLPAQSFVSLPASCLQPTELCLPDGLAAPTWGSISGSIERVQDSANWWLGDWCLYGETAYGEEHSQYLPDREEGLASLKVYRWVALSIPPDRRRLGVSWSVHREVAGCDLEMQEQLLSMAEAEGWSCRRMREAVNESKGKVSRAKVDKQAIIALSAGAIGRMWEQEDHARVMEAVGGGKE